MLKVYEGREGPFFERGSLFFRACSPLRATGGLMRARASVFYFFEGEGGRGGGERENVFVAEEISSTPRM